MRLIDADELSAALKMVRINTAFIDAAPTISCGECRFWNPARFDDWGCCENKDISERQNFTTLKASSFGCVLFERRQPEEPPFNWRCPRCGSWHNQSEPHCPCELEQP